MTGPGAGFRLTEYVRAGGPRGFPAVYPTALEAVEHAEHIMQALELRPHRRPWQIVVADAWTGEPVSTVRPGMDRDTAVCVACQQPLDPFGPGAGGGDAGNPFAAGEPSAAPAPTAEPGPFDPAPVARAGPDTEPLNLRLAGLDLPRLVTPHRKVTP